MRLLIAASLVCYVAIASPHYNLAPVLLKENESAFVSIANKMLALMTSKPPVVAPVAQALGCYSILSSYDSSSRDIPPIEFTDISQKGKMLQFAPAALDPLTNYYETDRIAKITVEKTNFKFFDTQKVAPYDFYVSSFGYLSLDYQHVTLGATPFTAAYGASDIGNIFSPPYNVIAPAFAPWGIETPKRLVKTAAYFYEDPEGKYMIFQWSSFQEYIVNKADIVSAFMSPATMTFQAVLRPSGEIFFLYKDSQCFTYNQLQYGVKPAYAAKLADGTYVPSTSRSGACNVFQYSFPHPGSVVYLKPKLCKSRSLETFAQCV